MSSRRQHVLFITPGDPAGVGPEIVWKTLRTGAYSRPPKSFRFVCVGARAPFSKLKAKIREVTEEQIRNGELPVQKRGEVLLLATPTATPAPGQHLEGFQSGWAIEKATKLILAGHGSAIITGPISKERLNAGGFKYSGHTDFLAALCGGGSVTMMLANDLLRITLATVHVGLKDVPRVLTAEKLKTTILQTESHLRSWFKIRKPRIAVVALNPHAGESGMFGDEEQRVITPVIDSLSKESGGRYLLEGPFPADTLFAQNQMARLKKRPEKPYDAVVCMYHDQGLIPVKLLDFPHTVNVTLGLPIVRTSVDHGVAFDIAGKNKADPSSFKSALALAIDLVNGKERKSS